MIGAILLKRAAVEGFAAVDRHDLDAILDRYHDDAVFEYPGETILAGRYVGRTAIRAWFETWFELMPEIRFTVRHTAVEDIFALTATNTGYVEWELGQTDRGGQHHHTTGVTKYGRLHPRRYPDPRTAGREGHLQDVAR